MTAGGQLGRYRLLQLLGRGGMGEVHLASWQGAASFERLVAVKILGGRVREDEVHNRSLLREALIGVQLDHENVVQVLDLGEQDGRYFVAMEYVRGFSLSEVLKHLRCDGRWLPVRSAVHVARAIAGALDYVHNFASTEHAPLSLSHGDVSPSNILLGADGRIKLADFGVAAIAQELDSGPVFAGKLAFLPPEAFHGGDRCCQWDLYALGAVLYEMLAGEPAFPGSSMREIRESQDRGPAPLMELPEPPEAQLAAVVERALHPDPDRRFSTATELARSLDAACRRTVRDVEDHRAYLAELYQAQAFVADHGALPTAGSFSATLDLAPLLVGTDVAVGTAGTIYPAAFPVLRLGLSPAIGPRWARECGEQLTRVLAGRLVSPVRPVVFGDYQTLVDCIANGEVDLAWMPPVAFVEAADRGARLLAVSERHGRTSYESALVVHRDSEILSLDDLRGADVAWVDAASSSGYLFPAAQIAARFGAVDAVLGRQFFQGSHRAACEAVNNGWAAVCGTYCLLAPDGGLISGAWRELLPDVDALRPIAYSEPIPGDNLACRPELPEAVVADVTEALLALHKDPDGRALLARVFHADRFARAAVDLYDVVRATTALVLAS